MIAEYDGAGALQRRFVHSLPPTGSGGGPGADEPIVWYEGAGTTDRRFLGADERGSIISISDGTGAMLNLNRYDDYGKPQATNAGRFGYTGQTWLSEVGLNYYKARMYAPQLGRFLQTDPIGGMNQYAYVSGDPVNFSDPSGLWETPATGCLSGSSCGMGNTGLTGFAGGTNSICPNSCWACRL